MSLRVADLFCGAGGFSQGFQQTGQFEIVLGIDVKQACIDSFATNHAGAIAVCRDIRYVRTAEVAELVRTGRSSIDVVIAGPPCQGFSSIRPYRSINENDHRNNLLECLLLFVGFFQPEFVVFENVVGLSHHKSGRTMRLLEESFDSIGYQSSVRVLNAVHYGVPQKRERVILLARKGKRRPLFPEPRHRYTGRSMGGHLATEPLPLFSAHLLPPVTVAEAIHDLPPVAAGESRTDYCTNVTPSAYAEARRKGRTSVTLHAATRHTSRMLEIIRQAGPNRWALPEGLTSSGFSSTYSRLCADEPSTTLTVNFVHPASNRCIHPVQNRALTPREGARLQSFDDDFEFCGSRSKIVKQIGEAVPPLLSRAIAEAILDQW